MSPDHRQHAPRPLPELVADIRHLLAELGYSEVQIDAAIAGAYLFGHLRPGGALWYVEHVIDHTLRPAHCRDDLLEGAATRAGEQTTTATKHTTPKTR